MIVAIELLLSIAALHPISIVVTLRGPSEMEN